MIAYEISINGKKLCLAGIDFIGMFFINIHHRVFIDKDNQNPDAHSPMEARSLSVSAIRNVDSDRDLREFLTWIEGIGLTPGDEVRIRVVETDAIDPPGSEIENIEDLKKRMEARRAAAERNDEDFFRNGQ